MNAFLHRKLSNPLTGVLSIFSLRFYLWLPFQTALFKNNNMPEQSEFHPAAAYDNLR